MFDYQGPALSPETLCQSKHDFIAKFHKYLVRNNWVLDEKFGKFFPFLSMCEMPSAKDTAPPIMLLGSKADQQNVFGSEWAKTAIQTGRTPDFELEKHSALGYHHAAENDFFCQKCEAIVSFNNKQVFIPFIRYIARCKEPTGAETLALFVNRLDHSLQ